MEEVNSPSGNRKERKLTGLIIAVILIAAALVLWIVFGKDSSKSTNQNTQPAKTATTAPANAKINSLISYQLPSGWTSTGCSNPGDIVLIVPSGKVSPDCASLASSWPMKITIDPQNTTECSQIKVNSQQVTNHVCSSKFINGSKFFVSSTTYNDKSSYGKNTKVSDYYVKTSNGVVRLEYADDLTSPEDDYQADFDQIANSAKVK
jgi:Tfp pilus assembly protein PilV